MFELRIRIANPFHKEIKSPWKSIYQVEKLITKHKAIEFGVFKYSYSLFEFNLDTRFRGSDHAGPEFGLSVLGYEIRLAMHDTRHWDYDKDCWYEYDKDVT